MTRLDGKIALITGGAQGIGAATARRLAADGAMVAVSDQTEQRAKPTVDAIVAAGGKAIAVGLDVTSEAAWTAAVSAIEKRCGGLDILVNNAGVFIGRSIEEATLADWSRLVAVNMTGVFLGTKHALPALKARGANSVHGSVIVNLASVAGLVGSALDPLYSMSKGGVTLFTKSTAIEFGRKGYRIRANSVHPSVIDTDMGAQTYAARARMAGSNDTAAARETAAHLSVNGRVGVAEDVANAIAFLASDDSGFMTGSSLVVDGGLTAQ